MTTTAKITKSSTMQEVLEAYPSAQRALFRRYHIGGCNSCGYQPEDILEEVVAFIQEADEVDRRIQASPREVAEALRSSVPPRLVDVRTREEWDVTHLQGATLVSEELTQEMMQWPKDAPIVVHCHTGNRSTIGISVLARRGYTNLTLLENGWAAWEASGYEVERP